MTKSELIKIVGKIKSEYPDNKLAYLAMTSKVEHQMRDAIAHQMHIELQKIHSTSFVCREWEDIDAEILDSSGNPELLVEFKAHSSINFPGWVLKEIVKDIKGLIVIANKYPNLSPDLYFVFFNNLLKTNKILPKNPITNKPIAYEDLVIGGVNGKYEDKVLRVIKNWAYLLSKLNLQLQYTSVVEIDAGIYLNSYPVSILAFLYDFKKASSHILDSRVLEPNILSIRGLSKFHKSEFDEIKIDGIVLYSIDGSFLYNIKRINPGIICKRIK